MRVFLLLLTTAALAQSPIDYAKAHQALTEQHDLCMADNGQLWHHTLCGAILFVDPDTHFAVANQPDKSGTLHAANGVYIGQLAKSENIANTSVEWQGTLWTELMWPVPEDQTARDVLLMHESFHHLQKELDLFKNQPPNNHLDTLEGRYWFRLELRALAAALRATGPQREEAVRDALTFRQRRLQIFPDAATAEFTLESNEGLAEYTGVKTGLRDPQAQLAYALKDLERGEGKPSYVRSFAYATGPAYGLLLDAAGKSWHDEALKQTPITTLLAETVSRFEVTEASAQQAAKKYDAASLWKEETARADEKRKREQTFRAQLIDGPVLRLAFTPHMSLSFDPNKLFPFADYGTVYPQLRISDDWGILEVTDGGLALVSPKWDSVTVPAPKNITGFPLQGPGYTLNLNPGYTLKKGTRLGDLTVAKTAATK